MADGGIGGTGITAKQLSDSTQCPIERAKKWVDPINAAMDKYSINTPLRIAHFIAQVAHESGRFLYVRELASGREYNTRVDLGNMKKEAIEIAWKHGSVAGVWWKGHGLIQVTGYDNHMACGKALGLDLANNPRLLEQPEYAALSAAWFWDSRKLNDLADQDSLDRITKRVNGGLNGIENRRLILNTTKEVLSC